MDETSLRFSPLSAGEHSKCLYVYWCMPPSRDSSAESFELQPADLPIHATVHVVEFTNVLKCWLERNDTWRSARNRFSTALSDQHTYDIDRIVGAANMFDILPSSACPTTVTLSQDIEKARNDARKAFQALPASPERDSVLGTLGCIGKASLKRKVRSRAKPITDIVGARFPELDLVVDQAIDCRNYFVHGSVAKIDYDQHFDQVMFFVDTLEFIFSASDLVESGWDIASWITQGTTLSHPFGRYRVGYTEQLGELKKLLQ